MNRIRKALLACTVAITTFAMHAPQGSAVLGTVAAHADTVPLRVAEIWEIDTLDPAVDGTLMKEKALVTETLVTGNPDFTIAPGLATDWQREGDLDWIFRLRPNVTFHDGTPLTADAVVTSIERALDRSGTVRSYTKIASVKAVDDETIAFSTTEPFPALPAALVYSSTAIVSPDSPTLPNGTIERPIGTGPFRVTAWEPTAQTFRVEHYDGYWGEKPTIEAMEFRGIPDPTTRSLEMQKGEIDFTSEVPYGDLDGLEADGFEVFRNVTARDYLLSFGSLHDTPFADVRLRKALSMAIDREAIVEYVLFGMGEAAAGPFPKTMAFADPSIPAPKFDVDAALTLFAEAGYEREGDGPLEKDGVPLAFTIYTYPQRPGLVPIAGALQAMFRDIGIDAGIKVTSWDAIEKEMRPTDLKLSANASAMYPHPDFFLRQTYHSEGATNTWGYANPEIDAALAHAVTSTDPTEQAEAYNEVQRIVAEEEPALIIAYYGVNVVMKPEITNYTFNPIAHDYMLDPKMRVAD